MATTCTSTSSPSWNRLVTCPTAANGFPARADDFADAILGNEERVQPWRKLGYLGVRLVGSLADGRRYGFGNGADVVAVVTHSSREPWWQRPLDFDPPTKAPVDVDLFVYTEEEFANILARGDLFSREMQRVDWL